MNLIRQLLSRRHHTGTVPAQFYNWPGYSGAEYQYLIYPLETAFPPLPGNYIYAMQTGDGNWVPLYVAQTRDMHQRLEGSEKLQDAITAGATHIHVHFNAAGQAIRCSEEHDLMVRWRPRCNEQLEA